MGLWRWTVVFLIAAACGSKGGVGTPSGSGGRGAGGQDSATGGTGSGGGSATGGSAGAAAGGGGATAASGGVGAGSGGTAGTGEGGSTGDAGTDTAATPDGGAPPVALVWRSVTVPGLDSSGVSAIWGVGTSELYVGTYNGNLFHRVGATWTKASSSSLQIDWIWGSGSGDVYTGEGGRSASIAKLRHSTGNDVWTPVVLPTEYTVIRGIWGPSANEVFVAAGVWSTGLGAILHLKNGAWTAEPTGQHILNRVWGSSATDIYAIGSDGETLYHSDGAGTWSNQRVGYGRWMYGLWGSGPGDVYAVISPDLVNQGNAFIAHGSANKPWTLEHGLYVEELMAVWGSGPRDVYVGGRTLAEDSARTKAVLYRSTGDGQWSPVALPAAAGSTSLIKAVWGSSASDVYLGGFATTGPLLLHGTPN